MKPLGWSFRENTVICSASYITLPGKISTALLLEIKLLTTAIESNSIHLPLNAPFSLPLAKLLHRATFSFLNSISFSFTPTRLLKSSSLWQIRVQGPCLQPGPQELLMLQDFSCHVLSQVMSMFALLTLGQKSPIFSWKRKSFQTWLPGFSDLLVGGSGVGMLSAHLAGVVSRFSS